MKGKKIILVLIIINILLLCIVYNFIKKEYILNEKIIIKTMTGKEFEDNVKSLNQSHEDFTNYIKASKTEIASAITDMGVATSNESSLENMATNIRNIARNASSISYDNTNTELSSTNVQGAVDEIGEEVNNINNNLKWKKITLPEIIPTTDGVNYKNEAFANATELVVVFESGASVYLPITSDSVRGTAHEVAVLNSGIGTGNAETYANYSYDIQCSYYPSLTTINFMRKHVGTGYTNGTRWYPIAVYYR